MANTMLPKASSSRCSPSEKEDVHMSSAYIYRANMHNPRKNKSGHRSQREPVRNVYVVFGVCFGELNLTKKMYCLLRLSTSIKNSHFSSPSARGNLSHFIILL